MGAWHGADRRAARPARRGPRAAGAAARGDAGDDKSLWRRLCGEIGVAGLAIPQRYGGAGAGPVETHIVMEELGRGLTCSPLLGSAVLAAQALLASGDTEACQRLLPAIADGSAVAALAWTTPAGHWDPGEAACAARPAARTTAADAIQAIAEAAGPPRPTGTRGTPPSAAPVRLVAGRLGADGRGAPRARRRPGRRAAGRRADAGRGGPVRGGPARPWRHPRRRDHHGHHPPAGHRAAGPGARPGRSAPVPPRPPWPGPGISPASRSAPSRWGRRSGRWS